MFLIINNAAQGILSSFFYKYAGEAHFYPRFLPIFSIAQDSEFSIFILNLFHRTSLLMYTYETQWPQRVVRYVGDYVVTTSNLLPLIRRICVA